MLRPFAFAAIVLVAFMSPSQYRLRAGELDLGILDPIGKVGEIGKVEPIAKDADSTPARGSVRPLADSGYIVCWNRNLAREPKWRCTQQLADLPKAREFSNYQNGRYELGQSFFLSVHKKDWKDLRSRKAVMERVQSGAIPKAMERVASRDDEPGRNPQRAALIRKQIQFVQAQWVDVKPVLPEGVKATDARVSEKGKVAYDDNFIPISVEGDWYVKDYPNTKYRFLPNGKLHVETDGTEVEHFSGKEWSQEGNVVKFSMAVGANSGRTTWDHEATVDGNTMKVVRKVDGQAYIFTFVRD
jgi:hypothetical protein